MTKAVSGFQLSRASRRKLIVRRAPATIRFVSALMRILAALVFVSGVFFADPLAAAGAAEEQLNETEGEGVESADEERVILERLEFRSFIRLSEGMIFGLHDPTSGVRFMLEPGAVRHGFEILGFDLLGKLVRHSWPEVER